MHMYRDDEVHKNFLEFVKVIFNEFIKELPGLESRYSPLHKQSLNRALQAVLKLGTIPTASFRLNSEGLCSLAYGLGLLSLDFPPDTENEPFGLRDGDVSNIIVAISTRLAEQLFKGEYLDVERWEPFASRLGQDTTRLYHSFRLECRRAGISPLSIFKEVLANHAFAEVSNPDVV